MKAIIRLDVPEWQIGQEVKVYFPDTMCVKGICELDRPKGKWIEVDNITRLHRYSCSVCGRKIVCEPSSLVNYKACRCGADMRGDKS